MMMMMMIMNLNKQYSMLFYQHCVHIKSCHFVISSNFVLQTFQGNAASQTRVNFRLACFVFSSLSGHAPSYLSDDIHLVSEGPRRRLRSSTDRSCVVPRTHNTFSDRSFAVTGPLVWNSLPGHLRNEDITYSSFRRELKTYWIFATGVQCLIARYKYSY